MKKIIIMALLVCSTASFANPWKECGIGAMIFDDDPTIAVISNIIWDLGSTAVTSATASPDTCEGKKATAAKFINETYSNLEEETVNGQGDHIDAMLTMLGCDLDSKEIITASIRDDLSVELASSDYLTSSRSEKAESYYNIVDAAVTDQHSQYCTI